MLLTPYFTRFVTLESNHARQWDMYESNTTFVSGESINLHFFNVCGSLVLNKVEDIFVAKTKRTNILLYFCIGLSLLSENVNYITAPAAREI